jgi:type III pantothenate kinase
MALGVPVLATNVGGPCEIVEDGVQGLLLPPLEPAAWAAAVRQLAERPELAAEMGRAGRARVQRAFTVQQHIRAMLAVYDRALSRQA